MLPVVTPGFTISAQASRISAAKRPAFLASVLDCFRQLTRGVQYLHAAGQLREERGAEHQRGTERERVEGRSARFLQRPCRALLPGVAQEPGHEVSAGRPLVPHQQRQVPPDVAADHFQVVADVEKRSTRSGGGVVATAVVGALAVGAAFFAIASL